MVDESSTAYYTVQALRTVKDLTVISNSLEILRFLLKFSYQIYK